jgi:prophage regulatory protein
MTAIEPFLNQATIIEPSRDRILRLPEVKARTGLSRSSIYAYIKEGKFPQHISLGERSVGWYESEIDAWVASRHRVNRSAQ